MAQAADNLLRRKLKHGGVARAPLPDVDFIGETFARQVEEGLRPLIKASISAMVLECKIVKLSDETQNMPVPTALGLFEVDEAKTQGLLNIDTDLAYHLIDLMVGGDPSVSSMPITRSFTKIDFALLRLAFDALLVAFTGSLASCFGRRLTKRVEIVAQRQDITQIRFATNSVDALVYNLTLDMGEAARSGNLQLLLPLAALDLIRATMETKVAAATEDRPEDLWRIHMRRVASTAPVRVTAVLYRQKLTIAALQGLKPGDVVEIPVDATDRIQLMIAQPGGKSAQLASGRLGVYQGSKVVKLESAIDPRASARLPPNL